MVAKPATTENEVSEDAERERAMEGRNKSGVFVWCKKIPQQRMLRDKLCFLSYFSTALPLFLTKKMLKRSATT